MENYLQHFGKQLYRLRKRASLTQKQLADRLGLSQPYLALLENGGREPTLTVLLAVVDLFDVGIDALLGIGEREPLNPLDNLSDEDRELIEPLLSRLSQAKRTARFSALSDSVRAVGSNAVRDGEAIIGVDLAPPLMGGQVVAHPLQQKALEFS